MGGARRALPAPGASARPHPTLVLGVILATYLKIVLDASVVAQAVATALTGSAVLLALGLAVVVAAVRRPSPTATATPVLEVTR